MSRAPVLRPLLLFALVAGWPLLVGAAEAEKKTDVKTPPKTVSLASVQLKGSYPETTDAAGLFGEMSSDLRDMIRRLDAAAADKDINGVVLHLDSPQIGYGRLNELRAAVARTRAAGKKVYATGDTLQGAQYLLACACDQIVMPPSGTLMVHGVSAELMFYKNLFEKVGIEADFLQVGKYKGAAEPYTREAMSEPFRQQYEAVIDDIFEQMVGQIADARVIHPTKVKELIDQGLFTASAAKKAGLVDVVAYEDEFQDRLKGELKVDELKLVRDYAKKKVDTDFSGITGMMKLMELMMGGNPSKRTSRKPKIAVVYAVGVIVEGESSTSLLGGSSVGSATIVKALRTAEKDDTVKAIVLRVDSPGGSATASDLIWREVTRIKKPVIASMGDIAASGGYYISMGADKILAEPGTLTGSIGVVGGKLSMKGLFDKVGLTTQSIRRGQNAGMFSSQGKFTDSEKKVWQAMMNETYGQFVSKAAQGRKMDRKKLQSLAEGRIWTGRMAAGNGLVDRTGTLKDAIAEARKLASVKDDEETEVLVLPEPKSFFEVLFGSDASLQSRAIVGRQVSDELKSIAPEVHAVLGDLRALRQLYSRPAVLMLPYRVEIK